MFAVVLLFGAIAFGQAPQPGTLTVAFDGQQPGCNVTQVSCVSQVNGVPVCPYGRVGWYPKVGQPYTFLTYPKKDQNGTAINFFKCVYMLPTQKPWLDPNFLTGVWF